MDYDMEVDEVMEVRASEWEKVVSGLVAGGTYTSELTIEQKKERYAKLVKLEKGAAADVSDKSITQRLFLRDMKGSRDVCGPADIPIYPILYENGAFYGWYWQMMFGVFLNRILNCVKVEDLELHVFCVGWGGDQDEKNPWWLVDPELDTNIFNSKIDVIVNAIRESSAFQALPDPNTLSDKKHLRVVVWMMEKGHAFAVCWDVFKKSGGALRCVVFQLNTLPPSNVVQAIMTKLGNMLETAYRIKPVIQGFSAVSASDIGVSIDFPCAPFMARSTLYIAMCSNMTEVLYVYMLSERFPGRMADEKGLYLKFEDMLLEFVTSKVSDSERLLLVPETFYTEKILNINDIFFESYDKNTGTTQKYVFNGFEHGFVEVNPENDIGMPSACGVQTLFHPQPSPLPSLLLSASALKECMKILLDAKARIKDLRGRSVVD